jgi:hypothetical protein
MPELTTQTTPEPAQGARAWLAQALDEGLRLQVLAPAQLLLHATPEVLAERLPRELMVKVFASAFSTGKLTPEGILAVAPPATLVEHLPAPVLWAALRSTEVGQAADPGDGAPPPPKGPTPLRQWLGSALAAGLERGLITANEVASKLPPSAWVSEVPPEIVAGLIGLGLSQPAWNAEVMLRLLEPRVIGEHVAPRLTWAIVDAAAARAFGLARTGGEAAAGGPAGAAPVAG